jgi:hypothetical protein
MEQRKELARKGFGNMKIDELKLIFGTWNVRALEESGVTKIMESAENDGLNNVSLGSAMPIIISSKDLDFSQLVPFTEITDKTPPITFRSHVKEIRPASGHHRHTAHDRLVVKSHKQLDILRKKLAADEEMDVDDDDGTEKKKKRKAPRLTDAKKEQFKRDIVKWEAMEQKFGIWLGEFFDDGE